MISSITTNKPLRFAALLFAGMVASAAPASQAAIIDYQWALPGNGGWHFTNSWNPKTIPGAYDATDTSMDRATLSGSVAVTASKDIIFRTRPTPPAGKEGEFNALTVTNGATLTTTAALRVTSSEGYTRNVLIGSTSSVSTKDIFAGSDSGSGNSTWLLQGSLTATNLTGYKSTGAGQTGGFIFNLDGGSLNISGTFDWRNSVSAQSNSIGQINIFNGGTASLGTLQSFGLSSNDFINFYDGTGSLLFSYGDYTQISSVQALIDDGFIRMDHSVEGTFDILDTSTGWLISVKAIPEASTYVLSALGALLLTVANRKRKQGQ